VVGHRVVHGGTRFRAPVLVDDAVVDAIRELSSLAPLHNPAGLAGIEAARRALPEVPQVAVFDTAFHATLPEAVSTYTLDRAVADRYGIRRYGFHGISVGRVAAGTGRLLGRPVADLNMIVLHLGNGASATAVAGGRSVETSMGLTPLEGLVMGSRTGDIDPAVAFHLAREAGRDRRAQRSGPRAVPRRTGPTRDRGRRAAQRLGRWCPGDLPGRHPGRRLRGTHRRGAGYRRGRGDGIAPRPAVRRSPVRARAVPVPLHRARRRPARGAASRRPRPPRRVRRGPG